MLRSFKDVFDIQAVVKAIAIMFAESPETKEDDAVAE